jgi:tRNA(Arg) A34 adenosine deaminase TadA
MALLLSTTPATQSYAAAQISAPVIQRNRIFNSAAQTLTISSRIHGEISAINACTAVFAARNMTATQIFAAWAELSICTLPTQFFQIPLTSNIDTNAESCPMCASAIRWSGFKEYIYGTTIQHNYNAGWGVITLSSYDVFQQTRQLPGYQTVMLGKILTNETDPLFSWQYNESYPCPNGCVKRMSKTRGYLSCVDPASL